MNYKGIAFTISNKINRIKLSNVLKKEKWIYLNKIIIVPNDENTIMYPELNLIRTSSNQFTEQIRGTAIEFKKVIMIKDNILIGTNKMMSILNQEVINCQETELELIVTNCGELSDKIFQGYVEYDAPEHECLLLEKQSLIQKFKSFIFFKN